MPTLQKSLDLAIQTERKRNVKQRLRGGTGAVPYKC